MLFYLFFKIRSRVFSQEKCQRLKSPIRKNSFFLVVASLQFS